MVNTLANILQVVRPIRMYFVASYSVPLSRSVRFLAPALAPLSEASGVSTVPLSAGVIFCDYPESSRELHRFIPFTIRVGHERKGVTFGVIRSKDLMPSLFSGDVPKVLNPDTWLEAKNGGMNRLLFPGSPQVRPNLMMTAQRAGILVASKPTDEGALGSTRNTKNLRMEKVHTDIVKTIPESPPGVTLHTNRAEIQSSLLGLISSCLRKVCDV
jgi:hypothetical protein